MTIIVGTPIVVPTIAVGEPVTFNSSIGRAGLWTGFGAPVTVIGAAVGDEYLDADTGNLYRLDPG